jgi:hypothetical protein
MGTTHPNGIWKRAAPFDDRQALRPAGAELLPPDFEPQRVEIDRDFPTWSKAPKDIPAPEGRMDLSRVEPDLEEAFTYLARQWKCETGMMSLFKDRVAHPLYKAIIALDRKIIPLLLRELQKSPYTWIEALETITKVDPVKPEDIGDAQLMIQAWLDWGKSNGYLR